MKYTTIILILTLPLYMAAQPSSAINWDEVIDRYIEKYQATEVPQWIFPIIFENGLNERDTFYIGYDPDINSTNFQNYGNQYAEVDSSSFEVFLDECTTCDTLTVRDLMLKSSNPYFEYVPIRIRYGYYPVTMYYNSELFYSDSLMPFVSNTTAPNLQGEVWLVEDHSRMGDWDENNSEWNFTCPWLLPCIITDSVSWSGYQHFPDSLDIAADVGSPAIGVTDIAISFKEWEGGNYSSLKESIGYSEITIFPNPARDKLTIKMATENIDERNWKLINVSGKIISTGIFLSNTTQIDISILKNGFYFLHVFSGNEIFVKKIIVSR